MRSIVVSRQSLELLFIGLILTILVGFRPLKYFNDTDSYIIMIHSYDEIFQVEPTFWIINQFNQVFLGGHDQIFFLIYAILGVSFKLIAIKRTASFPILSLLIYLCFYIILHDMTQIRAGVASGIFLLAIPDIVNRNPKKYFLKTALAMSFHYSAIIMVLVYFLNGEKINKKIYFIVPIFGLILSFMKGSILSVFNTSISFLPAFLSSKINVYLIALEEDIFSDINIYNLFYLTLIALYYFLLFNFNRIESKLNIVLIKIFALQLFVYYAFSSVPVIAGRMSEFLGIIIIFLLPQLLYIFKNKIIISLVIILFSFAYLLFTVSNGLIRF